MKFVDPGSPEYRRIQELEERGIKVCNILQDNGFEHEDHLLPSLFHLGRIFYGETLLDKEGKHKVEGLAILILKNLAPKELGYLFVSLACAMNNEVQVIKEEGKKGFGSSLNASSDTIDEEGGGHA